VVISVFQELNFLQNRKDTALKFFIKWYSRFFLNLFFAVYDFSAFFKSGVQIYECYHSHQTLLKSFPAFILLKNFSFFKNIEFFYFMRFKILLNLYFTFIFSISFFKSGCKDKCVTIRTKYFSVCYLFCFVKELASFCEAGRKDSCVIFTSKYFLFLIIHKR
jgi:hypothetical protein